MNKLVRVLIGLIVGLVPLIVFCKAQIFIMPVIEMKLNLPTTTVTDFFTYYKQVILLLITAVLLVVFGVTKTPSSVASRQLIQPLRAREGSLDLHAPKWEAFLQEPSPGRGRWHRVPDEVVLNISVLVFVLALCMTMLTAEYKTFTVWGGYTRNLGALTYLACAGILFVLAKTRMDGSWLKIFVMALYPLVLVNAVLVVLMYYGVNILESGFIAALLTGGHPEYLSPGARIFGTLNHPNYLSGLGAILFAIFAGKAVTTSFCAETPHPALRATFPPRGGRLLDIVAAVMGGTIVFASEALSGAVTMIVVIVLLLGLVLESKERKTRIVPFLMICAASGIIWVILTLHDAFFWNDLKNNAGLLLVSAGAGAVLFFVYLHVKYRSVLDKKKRLIVTVAAAVVCVAALGIVAPKVGSALGAELKRIDSEAIEARLAQDETDFPEAGWTWGTGRLYIWKEALGLVAQKPLFGYGFDTLPFYLDQTDPAKIVAMNQPDVVIDKPHNMYVNMLFGAGIVTFLAFAAIVGMVLWKGVKAVAAPSSGAGAPASPGGGSLWPLLLGIVAYLYQGLFNDPVQGVEPIFWVMMGLCYGLANKQRDRFCV